MIHGYLRHLETDRSANEGADEFSSFLLELLATGLLEAEDLDPGIQFTVPPYELTPVG